MTPIEKATDALIADGWEGALMDHELEHMARIVFESIDPEALARLLTQHRRNRAVNFGRDYACLCGEVLRSNSHHAQAEHQAQAVSNYLTGEPS